MINSKVYLATKVSLFMANYRRKLRIGVNIKRKREIEKAIEFAKRIKRIQEKAGCH